MIIHTINITISLSSFMFPSFLREVLFLLLIETRIKAAKYKLINMSSLLLKLQTIDIKRIFSSVVLLAFLF